MSDFRFPYNIETTLEPWKAQLGDAFDDVVAHLADRDRALEDHISAAGGHSHDGAGTDAIILYPSSDVDATATGAQAMALGTNTVASGGNATAVGYSSVAGGELASAFGVNSNAAGDSSAAVGSAATASADQTVAIGASAWAYGDRGIAIGHLAEATMGAVTVGQDANADGAASIAIGEDANAAHSESIALGHATATTGNSQLNIGDRRLYAGCPATAPTDITVNTSQFTVWLNEAGNALTFKVKYAGGTVKSGTVALT